MTSHYVLLCSYERFDIYDCGANFHCDFLRNSRYIILMSLDEYGSLLHIDNNHLELVTHLCAVIPIMHIDRYCGTG